MQSDVNNANFHGSKGGKKQLMGHMCTQLRLGGGVDGGGWDNHAEYFDHAVANLGGVGGGGGGACRLITLIILQAAGLLTKMCTRLKPTKRTL